MVVSCRNSIGNLVAKVRKPVICQVGAILYQTLEIAKSFQKSLSGETLNLKRVNCQLPLEKKNLAFLDLPANQT